ncbi:hypothetical protein L6V77_28950 [Myxococcota bacterium]|jgi:hypothetical protein|nr:hypothetical protein [Myxococcota bacterium]
MPASTVIVQHKDGSPGRQKRVVLGFSSGMTKDCFTDNHGRVVVEHSSTGRCTVYVDGRDCGSMQAPGTFAATLR